MCVHCCYSKGSEDFTSHHTVTITHYITESYTFPPMDAPKREICSILSKLLCGRIAQLSVIGVTILDEEIARAPRYIDEHLGRAIGYFYHVDDDLRFILFCRTEEGSNFDLVYIFYVNQQFRVARNSDAPHYIGRMRNDFKLGTITLRTSSPPICYPALLESAVECFINSDPVKSYAPYRRVDCDANSSFTSPNPFPFPSSCDITTPASDSSCVFEVMRKHGISFTHFEDGRPVPESFQILMIDYMDHLLYAINYRDARTVAIMIPHKQLFGSNEIAERLIDSLKSNITTRVDYFVPLRYFEDEAHSCVSAKVLTALLMCYFFPYLVLSSKDIQHLLGDRSLGDFISDNQPSQGTDGSSLSQQTIIYYPEPICPPLEEMEKADSVASLRLTDGCGRPYMEDSDSQRTEILEDDFIRAWRSHVEDNRNFRELIKSTYPLISAVEAKHDPDRQLLNDPEFFMRELKFLCSLFVYPTRAGVGDALSLMVLEGLLTFENVPPDMRFMIQPLLDDRKDLLIIIDRVKKEWVIIDPTNEAATNQSVEHAIYDDVTRICPQLSGFVGRPIFITSYYHSRYPRIHLLMSVYYLLRAIRYAWILPQEIIYQERDFRFYCHSICTQHEHANARHNYTFDLIEPSGYLRVGALVAHPSPVQYERVVVPVDQCIFCKKRYHKNLGAHMAMKHRDLARELRARRSELDSRRDS